MTSAEQPAQLSKAQRALAVSKGKREDIFGRVQAFYNTVSQLQPDELSAHRAILDRLQMLKSKFDTVQWEILEYNTYVSKPEALEVNQVSSAFEGLVQKIECKFTEQGITLEQQPAQNLQPAQPAARPAVRLPKLELKHFSGKSEDWLSFANIFTIAVHGVASLSAVEKFQYLISTLEGDALSLIKGLEITAANYVVAWDLLRARYHNERRLISYHIGQLLDLEEVKNNATSITKFLVNFREHTQALSSLKRNVMDGNDILVSVILRKLPFQLRTRLEDYRGVNTDFPKIEEILKFLEKECVQLEETTKPQKSYAQESGKKYNNSGQSSYSKGAYVAAESDPSRKSSKCPACPAEHKLTRCPVFLKETPQARRVIVQKYQLCFNCLSKTHGVGQCMSKGRCRACRGKHHTLIHLLGKSAPGAHATHCARTYDEGASSDESGEKTSLTHKNGSNTDVALTSRVPATVLLGTTAIMVKGRNGQFIKARALIDSGAMTSFCTNAFAKRAELTFDSEEPMIYGLGDQRVSTAIGATWCVIKPCNKDEPMFKTRTIVIEQITGKLPPKNIRADIHKKFSKLKLADENFNKPGEIDFLIGADVFPYIYTGKRILHSEDQPMALESIFGWVITGRCPTKKGPDPITSAYFTRTHEKLNFDLQKFWLREEPPEINPPINPTEALVEEQYRKEHFRNAEGRYVVSLPFKANAPELGDSFSLARSRLLKLEHKLNRNPQLKADYHNFMKEYEDLGHMKLIGVARADQAKYFIPHHCVINEDSKTTRTRVVFDASMKTRGGPSLNEILEAGPSLQPNIVDIIFRFRLHPWVFTADICKMYRQILVRPEDRPYQHILWRSSAQEPIMEYELNTVTYGLTPSSFLAIRTVQQISTDEAEPWPEISYTLKNNVFVDDIFHGAQTPEKLVDGKEKLTRAFKPAGMVMRKWSSNCPQVLEGLPTEDLDSPLDFGDETKNSKVLGSRWFPNSDFFSFKRMETPNIPTKRGLLSVSAGIFDCMGFVNPVTLWVRAVIQELWILGLDWDDPIPEGLRIEWNTFFESLPRLAELRIPRFVKSTNPEATYTLVGFCDASIKGYSANVYLVCHEQKENAKVNLVLAKSKVAPLKVLSIPRLELCGAELLSRLIKYCVHLCTDFVPLKNIFAFTDSTIVLDWIRTPPYQLKTFVANRVMEVISTLPPLNWYHVSSEENPADISSRGCMPDELIGSSLWFEGPPWLKQEIEAWPLVKQQHAEQKLEVKEKYKAFVTDKRELSDAEDKFEKLLHTHSSFRSLQRTTAWMFRFCHNAHSKGEERIKGPLKASELEKATQFWVLRTQKCHFQKEIEALKANGDIQKGLRALQPFLDKVGALRVGGRLRNSLLEKESKYPLLLPAKNRFTILLIDHAHVETLHGGPRLTMAHLNQRFWVVGCRSLVRSQLRRCITCFKVNPRPIQPIMGSLPRWRVQEARPFLNVAIDFGGPFLTKESLLRKARIHKSYLALFVCMATKAVHLEVVSDLTAKTFLAALDRFTARRGKSLNIYSDNGGNLVGTNNEQKELYDALASEFSTISEHLVNSSTTWHFMTPNSPSFGGLHEAGIKSAKHHLKRILGTRVVTFEELDTVFKRIEAVLNSRPLCPLSTDPSDLEALTPGHFLIGHALSALPEPNLVDTPQNRLDRWQLIRQAAQCFWQQWQNDYLNSLRQRQKWHNSAPNLEVGKLVLIKEDNLAPLHWRLGRIQTCYPGKDGIVRVVEVKTSAGALKRAVTRLCPLPLD
ncbi:uncharacterized protein [Bemisia tabaci]|uniref:uncharacterized protein n=1 Tax=Bemisia tabaci TaxID=7038 RepID=UPI003B286397